MPEYLSPGVYIEEFEIGARPIEGVSTSTTGFVGMAERGPLNEPTLVTSFAEYQRIFGGYLSEKEYDDKRWLPYAVEGFFNNGGKRVYVTRVAVTDKATESRGFLPDISGNTTFLNKDVNSKDITLKLNDVAGLNKDNSLLLRDGPQSEYLKLVEFVKTLSLDAPLSKSYDETTDIIKMVIDTTEYEVQDLVVNAESNTINLVNATGLTAGDALIIDKDDATKREFCVISSVNVADNSITLKTSLKFEHAADLTINKLTEISPEVKTKPMSVVKAGYTIIPIVSNDTAFKAKDIIKINDEYFFVTETDADNVILVADELKYQHKKENNIEIKQLVPAIEVKAVNEGKWGDKIKIVVKDDSLSNAKLTADAVNQNSLDLNTITGMEKGTLLKIHTEPPVPPVYRTITEVIKTDDMNRVILDSETTVNEKQKVSTVEFKLIVSFNGFEEVFKYLSMNEKHSRYIKNIITDKTSQLIRVGDVITTSHPENMPMPTKNKEPAWKLVGGKDGIPGDDSALNNTYKGKDNQEPKERTGLYTLKNIDDISIVAIPGISSQHIQNQLIIHCETMKDRFAVLDPIEKADLSEIQVQRNLYDSKYAALYYPWIRVFDPKSQVRINVPPSGHICGIYARSDTERGVHKAPANEKINGVLGLEKINNTARVITKGQQEILNPKGINCIRPFPGRGIRVWGARTISSDSPWKYINVRRLFLYIEESIEEGTQWVVFEPNNEKLWARVRATITQFLTAVWRDGALMGTKPEEAFFVKCDRSTMTQDDIDNGRLICIIGIAPVKPAEFVIFRIAQWAGGSAATE